MGILINEHSFTVNESFKLCDAAKPKTICPQFAAEAENALGWPRLAILKIRLKSGSSDFVRREMRNKSGISKLRKYNIEYPIKCRFRECVRARDLAG